MDIDSSKDQIIEGYQAGDERQYRSDGYISKTYDPDAWSMDQKTVGTRDDYHHGKSLGLDGIT